MSQFHKRTINAITESLCTVYYCLCDCDCTSRHSKAKLHLKCVCACVCSNCLKQFLIHSGWFYFQYILSWIRSHTQTWPLTSLCKHSACTFSMWVQLCNIYIHLEDAFVQSEWGTIQTTVEHKEAFCMKLQVLNKSAPPPTCMRQ